MRAIILIILLTACTAKPTRFEENHGDAGHDHDTDYSSDSNSDIDTDSQDTGADTETEDTDGTDTDTETSTDGGTDTDEDTESSSDTDTATDTETDTESDTGIDTDTETGTDTGDDSDTDSETESETETDIDTDTDTDTDSETDTMCPWDCKNIDEADNSWEICDPDVLTTETPVSVQNHNFGCSDDDDLCCQPIGATEPGAINELCPFECVIEINCRDDIHHYEFYCKRSNTLCCERQ